MKSNTNTILIIVGIVIIGFIVLQVNPEFIFSLSGNNALPDTNNYYNQTSATAGLDSRSPTGLMVAVAPNPATMGGVVAGAVTSDGFKASVTVFIKHLGSNQQQSFVGLLNDQGRFVHAQPFNVPGKMEVWATSGAVRSNTASLVVNGVAVVSSRSSVSKSLSPTADISVYSSYSGNAQIIANDPVHSISYPLTNCVVNAGGFGVVNVDFSGLPTGTYMVDAVLNGESASSYGGDYSVTVGR